MGIGCTPEQLKKVCSMIHETVGEWVILALPDGRFAALWGNGLECCHGRGVALGEYDGCYSVGTLKQVRKALADYDPMDDPYA